MTQHATNVLAGDAEARWRVWQARGAASDRRMAVRMRIVVLLAAASLAAWFLVALA